MIFNERIATNVAAKLLEIKAVILQPQKPFTWASGWRSPIYCDNRKTLSFPSFRSALCDYFCSIIIEKYGTVDAICGVATAGIPHGMLIAHAMSLPFIYVRSSAKSHGMQNRIEGVATPGQKVVVVEDLISSGKSSLSAVAAARDAGLHVQGLVAIFSYGFEYAQQRFAAAECPYYTLTDYQHLIQIAVENNYINREQLPILEEWRKDPAHWEAPTLNQ